MTLIPLLLACATPPENLPSEAPAGFTLVYQGGVDGEIEPCG